MAKDKTAAKPPAAKHVTLAPGQVIDIHVTKGEQDITHYVARADHEGVVTFHEAGPEAPPVQDPSPISQPHAAPKPRH